MAAHQVASDLPTAVNACMSQSHAADIVGDAAATWPPLMAALLLPPALLPPLPPTPPFRLVMSEPVAGRGRPRRRCQCQALLSPTRRSSINFSNKSNIFRKQHRHRLGVLPLPVDFVENFNSIFCLKCNCSCLGGFTSTRKADVAADAHHIDRTRKADVSYPLCVYRDVVGRAMNIRN